MGDRVTVTMLNGVRHAGTIRFRGETKFASGLWYGVELDNPEGRNGGSVQGVRYFSCPQKHGLFATASKLQKIMHSFSKIEAQKMNSQNFGGGESIKVFKNRIRFYSYVLVPHSFLMEQPQKLKQPP